MRVSVVFGTRGNEMSIPHLTRIIGCLERQSFQDFELIIVVDALSSIKSDLSKGKESPLEELFAGKWIEELRAQGRFQLLFAGKHTGGASYVRNFGMKHAKGELIQLFDDDNGFDDNYLETAVRHYDEMKKQIGGEVMICSTLMYRETGQIQNRGFVEWNFWQSRPKKSFYDSKGGKSLDMLEIKLFTGNGLLFNSEFIKKVQYDEQIAWIAEDFDFTLSMSEKGVRIFSFFDLAVRHYEREKNILELAWIGNYDQAHQKARNWFLFLAKHGDFWNKMQFYLVGLPGCLVWLGVKAIRYGGKERGNIIKGLFDGCKEGWRLMKSE